MSAKPVPTPRGPTARAPYVAYIDESGDEGFRFGAGSSDWFVVGGFVMRTDSEPRMIKLVQDARALLGLPPNKGLHFKDLKHEKKIALLNRLTAEDITIAAVLLNKHRLLNAKETFADDRLYQYLSKFLVERLSWVCRERHAREANGDGTLDLVFSNRSERTIDSFRDYLLRLKGKGPPSETAIDWNHVRPTQVATYAHTKRAGLQVADAVVGAIARGVEPDHYGNTEDRYARILKPRIYRASRYLGYGIKLWPKEAADDVRQKTSLGWLLDG